MPEDLKYIINQSQLTDIGAAIRSKLGEQDTYTVDEMPGKISDISGGGGTSITPILTLNLTTNTRIKMFNTSSLVLENNKLRSGEILTGIHEIIPYTGLQYAPEGYNFVIGEALSATLTEAVNCTLVEENGFYLISITNPDQNASATLNVSFEDIE